MKIGGILVFLYLVRLFASASINLHVDEAYYWAWSQDLALGYFDHPPMIAWITRLSQMVFTPLFPDPWHAAAFRAVPMFLTSVATPLLLMKAVEAFQKQKASTLQLLAIISSPIFIFGPQLATPDAPFFFFWAFCLWLTLENKRTTPWAVSLGIILGLCAFSKYSAILAAILIAFSGLPLRHVVIVAVTSLVVISPHLIWQISSSTGEGGGGILFQFRNGLGSLSLNLSKNNLMRMGDMWIVQLFFWTPTVFALLALSLGLGRWRQPENGFLKLLSWSALPLVFFSFTGLSRKVEGNWPLIGLLAALVLIVSVFPSRRMLGALCASNVLFSAFGAILIFRPSTLAPAFSTFSPRLGEELNKPSRIHELSGWDALYQALAEAAKTDDQPIEVASYQLLAQMVYFAHLDKSDHSLSTRLKIWKENSRESQFNHWPQYNLSADDYNAPRWLFSYADDPQKNFPCPIAHTLQKGDPLRRSFVLMRCPAASK